MHILLTNDDGYQSPGLQVLFDYLKNDHNVVICAPTTNQSGTSQKITINKPVKVEKFERGFHIDGTPADCVYLGIKALDLQPDLVISGINVGANLGDDINYSGTVGGAKEAILNSVPAIAVSHSCPRLSHLDHFCNFLINFIQNNKIEQDLLYNINFPKVISSRLEKTVPGKRTRSVNLTQHFMDNRGTSWLWCGPLGDGCHQPGTDFEAVNAGKISLSVLKI